MFSPVGKKKHLVQLKLGKKSAGERLNSVSPAKSRGGGDLSDTDDEQKALRRKERTALTGGGPPVASTAKLQQALDSNGLTSVVMRRIMEATSRYRPERDSVLLKAFQWTNISYDQFRHSLYATFWLTFTDEEYTALVNYFDADKRSLLNGYDFMIAFTRLGGMRKQIESADVRDQQQAFVEKTKMNEKRQQLEREKKNDVAVDYDFTPNEKATALRKLTDAAIAYDPNHPAAPNVKGFTVAYLTPSDFREMMKLTFNLKLTPAELGAVLKFVNADPDTGNVPCGDFLRYFMKLGFDGREKERARQRLRKAMLEERAAEENARKIAENFSKSHFHVDYNFSEVDEVNAVTKMREAGTKYDKAAPGAQQLDGFECESLTPAEFVNLVRRVFNLQFTSTELGYVVKKYDTKNAGNVTCKAFLMDFLKWGQENRYKAHIEQVERQREMTKAAEEEHLKKIQAVKESGQFSIDYEFRVEDMQSAMETLTNAAINYDPVRGVSMASFEPAQLSPREFKKALKRTFNLRFTPQELGALVVQFDTSNTRHVNCQSFLTTFTTMGASEKGKIRRDQLRQLKETSELRKQLHASKVLDLSATVSFEELESVSNLHMSSALRKMTEAATKYDANHPAAVGLEGFERSSMSPGEFKELVRRVFHLKLSVEEVAALFQYFDQQRQSAAAGAVSLNSASYTTSLLLGGSGRGVGGGGGLSRAGSARSGVKGSSARAAGSETAAQRQKQPKLSVPVESFDSNDASFVGARGPAGGGAGAELRIPDEIVCGDFLRYFLQLGIRERAKVHSDQLQKQRRENKVREEENQRKLEAQASRAGSFEIDYNYSAADRDSINEKIKQASTAFDPAHPASPSLQAFEVAFMPPGLFRENLKRVFNIKANQREMGCLMDQYDTQKNQQINSKEFMLKFFAIGKKERDRQRAEYLLKKRQAERNARKEAEAKVEALWNKAELQVDYSFTANDYKTAVEKMTAASEKYDKTHPAAPSLDGFSGGPIKPGVFRELMRRAFNVWLTPKELGAVVEKFLHHSSSSSSGGSSSGESGDIAGGGDGYSDGEGGKRSAQPLIDGKQFLIAFMRFGQVSRARKKTHTLEKQRMAQMAHEQERLRKLAAAESRAEFQLAPEFTGEDRANAFKKLAAASALYDKTSPGCVSLDAFNAAFLTPGMFREVAKRTFRVSFTAKELAAVVEEYNNGNGNLDSSKFLVAFIKMGTEEREKVKLIQLEKQRHLNHLARTEHDRKMKEAEEKMLLNVSYDYSDEERNSAFRKIAVAAKKFDKHHPAAMSVDGFEQKTMKAHVFREMIKRTFGIYLTNNELGAAMHHFDPDNSGTVNSHKFLTHFLKVGIAEREAEHLQSLKKLREDARMREREHQEKMAAGWAKMELGVTFHFTPEDRERALEKLTDASVKFDPASPGPMGLTAFQAKHLSPAVFKEMLRRSFNMKVSPGELAALIAEFDSNGDKRVDCARFMVTFTSLGFNKRSEIRAAQLSKQRRMNDDADLAHEIKKYEADARVDAVVDMAFAESDFQSALEKIRVVAANYDRSHPSAPSLKGFMGTNMKPVEFKEMLMRTFQVPLSAKELGALLDFFGADKAEEGGKNNKGKRARRRRRGAGGGGGGGVDSAPGSDESGFDDTEDEGDEDNHGGPKLNRQKSIGGRSAFSSTTAEKANGTPFGARIDNQAFLTHFNKIQRDEQSRRRRNRISTEREVIAKKKEHEKSLAQKKLEHEIKRLQNTEADEASFLVKIKKAANDYAIDSGVYNDSIQGFKGPSMPPEAFKDLFGRVFLNKLTFPEVGVLMSILDVSGNSNIDGSKFLNWFYKLSRIQGKYLLGESEEQITADTLRTSAVIGSNIQRDAAAATATATSEGTANSLSPSKHPSGTMKKAKSSPGSAVAGFQSSSEASRSDAFSPLHARGSPGAAAFSRTTSPSTARFANKTGHAGNSKEFGTAPDTGHGSGSGSGIRSTTLSPLRNTRDYALFGLTRDSVDGAVHISRGGTPSKGSSSFARRTGAASAVGDYFHGDDSVYRGGDGMAVADDHVNGNDPSSFTKSTIASSWLLPSIASAAVGNIGHGTGGGGNSGFGIGGRIKPFNPYDKESRRVLQELFDTTDVLLEKGNGRKGGNISKKKHDHRGAAAASDAGNVQAQDQLEERIHANLKYLQSASNDANGDMNSLDSGSLVSEMRLDPYALANPERYNAPDSNDSRGMQQPPASTGKLMKARSLATLGTYTPSMAQALSSTAPLVHSQTIDDQQNQQRAGWRGVGQGPSSEQHRHDYSKTSSSNNNNNNDDFLQSLFQENDTAILECATNALLSGSSGTGRGTLGGLLGAKAGNGTSSVNIAASSNYARPKQGKDQVARLLQLKLKSKAQMQTLQGSAPPGAETGEGARARAARKPGGGATTNALSSGGVFSPLSIQPITADGAPTDGVGRDQQRKSIAKGSVSGAEAGRQKQQQQPNGFNVAADSQGEDQQRSGSFVFPTLLAGLDGSGGTHAPSSNEQRK